MSDGKAHIVGQGQQNNEPKAVDPALKRKFVFGIKNDVKDGAQFLDENHMCWIAGKNIVLFDTRFSQQSFFPCSDNCDFVTAMAVSSNRRILAIAEACDPPQISIYSFDGSAKLGDDKLKKKRVLCEPDVESKEYVSIAFSGDGKYLAAQGGVTEWNLTFWNVSSGKRLAMAPVLDKLPGVQDRHLINQVSISPRDHHLVCISGNGIFKFFRYANNTLTQERGGIKGDPLNYLAHVWLLSQEDRMIVSTDNGDLLFLENGESRVPLPASPSDGSSIDTLIATTKGGFIAGGALGLVTIFEKSDDTQFYHKVRAVKIEPEKKDGLDAAAAAAAVGDDSVRVVGFSLSPPPTEEFLSMVTSDKQLYMLNLSNADFTKPDDRLCEPVSQTFHSGPITGLDICIRKPLIATCGKDHKIILWNYLTNTIEAQKTWPTEVLSIAIHPTGLHLLIGCPDRLRFMNVYGDDIREFKFFNVRACQEVKFSNGGQFFAAMHSTVIQVYFTYTCELLGYLRGHNNKVRSLYFVPPDDTRLFSAGADGAVHEWDLTTFTKLNHELVMKSTSFNAAVADSSMIWAADKDRRLRQLTRTNWVAVPDADGWDLKTTNIVCMTISGGMKILFAGCEDGSVRVYSTHLAEKVADRGLLTQTTTTTEKDGQMVTETKKESKYDILWEKHASHTGAVSRIAMSFDETMIVTAGEDGVLQLWEIVAPQRPQKKDMEFAEDIILIEKKDLEDKQRSIDELKTKVAELNKSAELYMYKKELKHEKTLQDLKDDYQVEKQKQATQLSKLTADTAEQKAKFHDYMAEMNKKHKKETKRIEQDNDAKIHSLEEQIMDNETRIKDQLSEFEAQKKAQRADADREMERMIQEHKQKMDDTKAEIKRLTGLKVETSVEAAFVLELIEEETDAEILKLKESHEMAVHVEKTQLDELSSKVAVDAIQYEELKVKLKALDDSKKDKQKALSNLYLTIKGYENDIKALEKELAERSETIGDKDKRIWDLRKKNQELEKFRFVLEYKIKELHEQLDPKDEEIRLAKAKYAEMEAEAGRYLHNNDSLTLTIKGQKLKLDGQCKEITNLKGKLTSANEYQSRLWTELSDLYDSRENPRTLKDMVKALYYKHTSTSVSTQQQSSKVLASRTTEDAQREYSRERDYLERTVANLKKKLIKDAETNRTDRSRIIGENVALIKEINELRREVTNLQQLKQKRMEILMLTGEGGVAADGTATTTTSGAALSPKNEQTERELQIQRAEIARLRAKVQDLEKRIHAAGKPISQATPPLV